MIPSFPAVGRTPRRALSPEAWIGLGLVVLVLAVYLQAAGFGFITYDDPFYITANDHVRAGLCRETAAWAFANAEGGNWAPLVWLSYAVEVSLAGVRPGLHHLVNVALHAANAVLWYRLLRELTGARWPSALVAALFAVHPLHVESVAWISERKDVLSCLFWILATKAYLGYARRSSAARMTGVAVLLVLGLMAKAMLVTLPVTLLLLDHWPLRRLEPGRLRSWVRLVLEKWPLFAVAAIFSALTLYFQAAKGAVSTLGELPLRMRVVNALLSYLRYLGMTAWPVDLAPFYPFRPPELALWKGAAAAALLAALTALALRLGRGRPWIWVGWAWYLVTLLPVIGFIQAGQQALADRYTYIPLVGLFLILAWASAEAVERSRLSSRVAATAWGVLLALLAAASWLQVGLWRDDLALFTHTLQVTRDNPVAHSSLGQALRQQGRIQEAAVQYAHAARLLPKANLYQFHLGDCLDRLGRRTEAEACFRRALELNPAYALAAYRLANLVAQARPQEAVDLYRQVLATPADGIMQDQAIARAVLLASRINLGIVLRGLGRQAESERSLRDALATDPLAWKAQVELAVTLLELGKAGEGKELARTALRQHPDEVAAYLRSASQVRAAFGISLDAPPPPGDATR